MGAIDLCFDVKRDSERLHQIVIGALLRHTSLLRLLGASGAPETDTIVEGEPLSGTYDLAVRQQGGGQIFVEIKVDSPISDERLRRQMQDLRAEGRAADRVLYLLLGYTAITASAPRIARAAQKACVTDDRHLVRSAADIIPLLGAVAELAPRSADARDLAVAYRDHLIALSERERGFFARPVAEWQAGDFYGFFAHCRRNISSMAHAVVEYVPSPGGGFVCCSWGVQKAMPGVEIHLQFDGARLCVKVRVEVRDLRTVIRDQACGHLLRASPPVPLTIVRPVKLGHGEWMGIGYIDGVSFGQEERFGEFVQGVQAAERIIAEVAAHMGGQA